MIELNCKLNEMAIKERNMQFNIIINESAQPKTILKQSEMLFNLFFDR